MLCRLCPSTLALFVSLAQDRGRTETSSGASDLDEVEVTAKRERASAVPDPTATTTLVAGERLARARARGDDLGALVDTVAGARVLDLGGPVSDRRLSLRGGTPSESLVIVDDVPERTPFATGVDLGLVGLDALDSVAVVRGGAGAALGDGALTGALLVTTKRPEDVPRESLLLSYGAFDTARVAASGSLHPVAVSASYERSRGDFPYVSRIRGLPDRDEVRSNNDAKRGSVSLRLDEPLQGGSLSVAGGGALREAGVPGLETQENLTARERRGSARLRASFRRPLVRDEGRPELLFGVSGHLLDIDYRDDDSSGLRLARSRTRFLALESDGRVSFPILERHVARASASLGAELSDSTEHGSPKRIRAAAALSDEALLGDLTLFGAVRTESLSGQELVLLPRTGVRYEASPLWSFRVGLGRSLRSPAIDEIYHPSEAGFSGNPDLASETAWEAEASFSLMLPRFPVLSLTSFGRIVSETILYLNRNAFVIRPENVGDSRAAGGEIELGWSTRVSGASVSFDASATVLFSELAATGRALPTQPRSTLGGEISVASGPAGVSSAFRYVGPTTANLQGTLEVPAYARWDLVLTLAPFEAAVFSLSVLNLLDDRTLESVHKIPLPGRTAFLSLRVSTDGGDAS